MSKIKRLSANLLSAALVVTLTGQAGSAQAITECSAAAQMASPHLGYLYAYAVDVESGKVLINEKGTQATPSASVLKVLTVAAALENIPENYTATTRVFTVPGQPGTIVLKGGGDHTLSQVSRDGYTTYVRAPQLSTLASRVYARWTSESQITKIILDDSFFSGPTYNSAWKASDRTNGYISHITGLQLDGDRANPDLTSTHYSGYRSTNPVLKTGEKFREQLAGLAVGAQLVVGKTPKNAVELTSISSQPIETWMDHAITVSDDTETEFIARHAAIAAGLKPTFASIEPMVKTLLADLKIDSRKLVMKDGSGLAQADRVTPKMITQLMRAVALGDPELAPLESYLPVAGVSGGLAGRFTGRNAAARGSVKGKTGFIPGLYSLAGIIDAKDGSRIAYAIFARSHVSKKVDGQTRNAIDTLASRFYFCGANLTE